MDARAARVTVAKAWTRYAVTQPMRRICKRAMPVGSDVSLMADGPCSAVTSVEALQHKQQQEAGGWHVRRHTLPIFRSRYALLPDRNAASGRLFEVRAEEKASLVSPSGHRMKSIQSCHQAVFPEFNSHARLAAGAKRAGATRG